MIYHYTKALHLPSIKSQGLIPASAFITADEKPINWFSTNPQWERTVMPYGAPSLAIAYDKMLPEGGLVRIVCDDAVAPFRWKELKDVAGIPSRIAMGLYKTAIKAGARPGEWRGTLDLVPVEKFLAVEVYDGQGWILEPVALSSR